MAEAEVFAKKIVRDADSFENWDEVMFWKCYLD